MKTKLDDMIKETKVKPETLVQSKRIPLGTDRDVLWVNGKRPDKKYSWINDYNVEHMKASGFEHVPVGEVQVSDHNRYGSQLGEVVCKPVGAGVTAYLMCIDRDLYEQDMEAINRKADAQEAGIYREANSGGLVGELKIGKTVKN